MRVSPLIISSLLTYGVPSKTVLVPKPASKPDDLAEKPALSTTPILSPPSRVLSEVSTEFRVNTYTEGSQSSPSITSLVDGGFVVAWRDGTYTQDGQDGSSWGVYAQRYGATGEKAGGEFRVNTYTANSQSFPSITSLADGGFVVVWDSLGQDGSDLGVYAQRYGATGEKAGGEFRVNTYTAGSQWYPSITSLADSGFVVSWTSEDQDGSGWGVYAQRYGATGEKAGGEFRVNTYTSDNQSYPRITSLTDGGFVVAWRDGTYTQDGQDGSLYGVYAQRYDATGEKAGGEFRVNTYTEGEQEDPSITSLAAGGFVVAWHSEDQDGSGDGVYAQRYDATGEKAAGEFRVNTYTWLSQGFPSITSLADGGFVVAWSGSGNGDSSGVYAQRYGATGEKAGGEFRVNTYTENGQGGPSITSLTDGGFVIAWSGSGNGDSSGVYAQKYDCMGNPVSAMIQSCPSENDVVQPITAFRVNTNLDSIVVVDLATLDESLGRFTVPNAPAGASIDVGDRVISITGLREAVNTVLAGITLVPSTRQPQNYGVPVRITVYAEGVVETTVSETIGIMVENEAPEVANPIPKQSIYVNEAWTFEVPDTVFDDEDSTLDLIAYDSTSARLLDGIQFDPASRTFTWTPTEASTRTIVLKATDSGGEVAYHAFELEVLLVDVVENKTNSTNTTEVNWAIQAGASIPVLALVLLNRN